MFFEILLGRYDYEVQAEFFDGDKNKGRFEETLREVQKKKSTKIKSFDVLCIFSLSF